MKLDRPLAGRSWIFGLALAMLLAALAVMLSVDAAPTAISADAASLGVSRMLVWIDRHGHRSALPLPVRGYVYPRISPDGTRIAVDIRDQAHGIWMCDVAAQSLTPFSTGRASDISPVWTRDGDWIVFARGRAAAPALLRKAAGSSADAEALPITADSLLLPNSLSSDGSSLIVTASTATGFDLQRLDLTGGAAQPLVSTSFDELNGELSPDGRWLAYQSRQSGQFEIWVRRFDRSLVDEPPAPSPQPLSSLTASDDVPATRTVSLSAQAWQVSSHGGTRPVWARNGRELFYLTADNRMMAAPIFSSDDFQSGAAIELFGGSIYDDLIGRTFDVSPDGRRFLVVMELMGTK
jgi:serine/threonine-protein kinase